MATKQWASAAQVRRFEELRQLSDYCYKAPPPSPPAYTARGGLLGSWPPDDEYWSATVAAADKARLGFLADFKQLPGYVWLSKQDNYLSALRGVATRGRQTKHPAYTDTFAEIALVRAVASPLLIHEISTLFPIEHTYPTADELRGIRKNASDLLSKLRTYSGLTSKLQSYDSQLQLTKLIERIDRIKRGYRKPRADGDQRGRVFAQSVAVNLNREFNESAPVILAPLCGLVDYSPHPTDLRTLARVAIKADKNLATL